MRLESWLTRLSARMAVLPEPILGGIRRLFGFREGPSGPSSLPGAGSLLFNHEMKNYLCAIRGNAYLLRQKASTPEQAALLDCIDKAVERLEGFALKEFAVADVVACRTKTSVDPVQAAQGGCQSLPNAGKAEFMFNASEGLPYIQGDPPRLEQVFINLYGNALEAGADRVRTQFRRIGDELEITVEDNGRGCSADATSRLFEPFYSTKPAPGTGGKPGTVHGLGLCIVRAIVENHGGRIRATSKNDRGFGETGMVLNLHFPLPATFRTPGALGAREDRTAPRLDRRRIAVGA